MTQEAKTPTPTPTQPQTPEKLDHLTHFSLTPRLFLDTDNPEAVTADIQVDELRVPIKPDGSADSLEAWYQAIDCRTVDIVTVLLDEQVIDIVVDDEGLMKPNNAPQDTILGYVITDDMGYEFPLAGVIVLAGSNDEGETISCPLTPEQITQLIEDDRIRTVGINSPYN